MLNNKSLVIYGFYEECLEKYGDKDKHQIWHLFINIFNHMPLAALINKRVLAIHGGISPYIKSLKDIEQVNFIIS